MHAKHSEALEFDLLTHGFAWRDAGHVLPWRDVWALARGFSRRPECEVFRALNPDHLALDTQLLREIEHGVRVSAWIHSEDAQRRRKYPERIPLTKAEQFAAKPERERYDLHTLDEIDKLIGW